jgi:asparagine synthase (glutamine-hydrolysing)
MCGIAGAIELAAAGEDAAERLDETVERMSRSMIHRGPDAAGHWTSPSGRVALAHRRLAIVDLSEGGRQPMSYGNGRYCVTFNGEIYNYRELRMQLRSLGHTFRTESDTEVLLAAIAEWGMDGSLQRTVGMFAFAVWDEREHLLHLARDRMGEKPLYLGEVGRRLFFASEVRAFRAIRGFERRISGDATAAYLRDGCVPGMHSIYAGVYKLGPGQVLTAHAGRDQRLSHSWLGRSASSGDRELRPRTYWSCRDAARRARQNLLTDETAAIDQTEALLRESIRLQMHADVPTGAFLSGGIDSTLVTALMQAQSPQPVRTFTVAFNDPRFDEEFSLSERDVVDRVPSLMSRMDEPTANGSFFPVCLISGLARTRVTVALSGDGGDELFAGYNRYALARRAWLSTRCIPPPLRRLVASFLASAGPCTVDKGLLAKLGGFSSQISSTSARRKLARVFMAHSFADTYLRLTSCWEEASMLEGSFEPTPRHWPDELGDTLSSMLLADQLDYLPDDNLAKLDRASMAVSLETRLPLLDYRLVELSWQLPDTLKLHGRVTKRLLRGILKRYVPRSLTERPKMGFSIPTEQWLTGALRDWAGDMLRGSAFPRMFPVRQAAVSECWDTFLAGHGPSAQEVWSLVVLAAWAHEESPRIGRAEGAPVSRPLDSLSA